MKPTPNSEPSTATPSVSELLVFGAHPDDIEFGCGGVIALESQSGRRVHFVICSRGEAGTNGNPAERTVETERAAKLLGATVEFIELDGDAHLEIKTAHILRLASLIRTHRPTAVLAPTLVENQHPDHARLGRIVRDAARLARYGGVKELSSLPVHAVHQVLYYAVTPDAEPTDLSPVIIDVSSGPVVSAWTKSMEAHASQLKTRNYVEFQIARARVLGLRAGVEHAIALWPNDPLVFDSLGSLDRSARRF
jgi:LmbE family N-acetylglucosaminyl deacetylase